MVKIPRSRFGLRIVEIAHRRHTPDSVTRSVSEGHGTIGGDNQQAYYPEWQSTVASVGEVGQVLWNLTRKPVVPIRKPLIDCTTSLPQRVLG